MAVNVRITIDTSPGGRKVEINHYDITRDTEDEAAIAALALLIAIYGKQLKQATQEVSSLLKTFQTGYKRSEDYEIHPVRQTEKS